MPLGPSPSPAAEEPPLAAGSRMMSGSSRRGPAGGGGSGGPGVCFGPREPDKPFADSERAQKWRLSLASLLFFTVLLSDHLWLCLEARQVAPGRHHRDPESGAMQDGPPTPPPSGQCFSLLGDAGEACRRLQPPSSSSSSSSAELYLPFCNSYTLRELFAGLSRPETRNCTLDPAGGHHHHPREEEGQEEGEREPGGSSRDQGEEEEEEEGDEWLRSCRRCVLAFQSYDQQARERYREFELVLQKYLQAEEYSVKSGPEDCKTVYKAWLCSQYFEVTQSHCNHTIPCKQYCLEVQTRCPFILPDNDDVIYGGLSSFICTGLYDNYPTNAEPECCDVRWGLLSDNQSKGTIKTSDSMMCHRTSLTVSSASRLCNSRLKLCVLVLILLHTVLTVSAAQNSTELGFGGITNLEDSSANEE
ncbi:transmembrane protein FAM155A [Sceloporus undulatus]|uniref:transmembrane protein FAM155A n=1 Tax=Sceloporus undulatus TaxID=8520 RepID=UPI001C4D136B|nr:transmembrane protein FAM155A [Sceloporus undulatus]